MVIGKELIVDCVGRFPVVFRELHLWLTSKGDVPTDSCDLLLVGLCDIGVEASSDCGCEAFEAPVCAGLSVELKDLLEKGSVLLLEPSWTCSHSVGRKNCCNYLLLEASFFFLAISMCAGKLWQVAVDVSVQQVTAKCYIPWYSGGAAQSGFHQAAL